MDQSPLSTLPPEIRNDIYVMALSQDSPITLVHLRRKGWKRLEEPSTKPNILALTKTCKNVRRECTQIFYAVNTFALRVANVDEIEQLLRLFRLHIGTTNDSALRSVVIELARFVCKDPSNCPDVEPTLSATLGILKAESATHGNCTFRVKFSFEIVSSNSRRQPDHVVYGQLDLSNLDISWQRLLSKIEGERKEVKGHSNAGRALLFLHYELCACRDDRYSLPNNED